MPLILLALEGKMDCLEKTNPFGPPKKPRKKTDAEKLQDQRNLFHRRRMDAAQRVREMKEKKHGK